jgi:hypothetical protein
VKLTLTSDNDSQLQALTKNIEMDQMRSGKIYIYVEALSYYELALDIQQRSLLPNHSSIKKCEKKY